MKGDKHMASKKNKFISLDGRTFQLKQRTLTKRIPPQRVYQKQLTIEESIAQIIVSSKMLDDCYKTPSTTKQELFNDWFKWACECDKVHGFGIRSYNTFMFTLQGYVMFNEFSYGLLDITPSHNYIWVDHLDMF